MPQSFACMNAHIVFSTKNRDPLIMPDMAPRRYDYIGGICRETDNSLVAAGGMADHVHLIVSLGKQTPVADVVRTVKANSSRWIHETFANLLGFAWQGGYGAFAVSYSQMDQVRQYIAGQHEHHRVRTFKEEFVAMQKRHNISYDERCLWD